ncbi:MAG TPA: glycoside hydrolase family 3 N-terminal domain-containing protein [Longimicrobium sp.]|jgi:beta-N-acetylhexosaminidase|uniref:glycoside hydrolase family 3 protein n=1 Tax=Longimicrobium sp. TaxID=2029185 RepID=UPI002ED8F05E
MISTLFLRPLWAALLTLAACSAPDRAENPDTTKATRATRPAAPEVPAIPPLRTDTAGQAWVEQTLAQFTLRQRVAQLVFPWISGRADPAEQQRMLQWVSRDQVGGLIVSTGTPAALASKLNAAQMRAGVPLLIVSDLETGPGMRLNPGGTRMPPAMAFGAAGDTALARQAGRATGAEARAVGIHLTLGPVLDVNSNPANPIINVRSFGESPEAVARLGAAWLQGARESGLLSVGKHFPGHGDTHVDSHVGLPQISGDSARLDRVELAAFRGALHAGMDGVLVGHIAAVGIEGPNAPPASLSPRMIGILRGPMQFRGIVFTDALNMGGVTRRYSVTEASILALLAGADALLQPPGHPQVIDGIVAAVESGRIPRARIDEAARRVLTAKAAAGLHRGGARVDPAAVAGSVATEAHREVARTVAARSITLARDRDGAVPLRRDARVLHVTYADGNGSAGGVLQRELAAGGVRAEHVRVGPGTPASTFASLRSRAAAADVVIASIAIAPFQYRSLGVSGGTPAFVEALAASGKPVIAVSLGSPYLLDAFPSVPAYLLAWDAGAAAEAAAAHALLGTAPITGRLPVSLPPHHRIGEGIDRRPE